MILSELNRFVCSLKKVLLSKKIMASHFTKLFLFYFKFIVNSDPYSYTCSVQYSIQFLSSVAEPEPVEPKLFRDLEPEPKINFNKHFLQSVWRLLE